MYDATLSDDRIDQGDLIDGCPVVGVTTFRPADPRASGLDVATERVIVLTQTCDLANDKTDVAVVAVVEDATAMVARGAVKAADVRGVVMKGRFWGLYFLPADPALGLPEMVCDFRRLHTVRLDLLAGLCRVGQRRGRVRSLYREHLEQALRRRVQPDRAAAAVAVGVNPTAVGTHAAGR